MQYWGELFWCSSPEKVTELLRFKGTYLLRSPRNQVTLCCKICRWYVISLHTSKLAINEFCKQHLAWFIQKSNPDYLSANTKSAFTKNIRAQEENIYIHIYTHVYKGPELVWKLVLLWWRLGGGFSWNRFPPQVHSDLNYFMIFFCKQYFNVCFAVQIHL